MKTVLNFLVLSALATAGARADIAVTFDDPFQSGGPGATLRFFGVISNSGSDTVFLNADNLNLAGTSFTVADLFFNTPLSLGAGMSSPDIELFDVTVNNPLSDPFGLYSGSYVLSGGLDDQAQDYLASADFGVATVVPEPGSWSLLAIALLALGPLRRLR
jgi:hypothetical protein